MWARRRLLPREERYRVGFESLKAIRVAEHDGQSFLAERIRSGEPLCVARFGLTELEVFRHADAIKRHGRAFGLLDHFATGNVIFSAYRARKLMETTGLQPFDSKVGEKFHDVMLDGLQHIDVLASWAPGEGWFSDRLAHSRLVDIEDLAAYRFDNPWTAALENKKVLVVHPYDKTIRSQYTKKRELIFENQLVLPSFELATFRPPQAYFGEIAGADHWFQCLEAMTNEVMSSDFDVALIGAGPFGMPLAAKLKEAGKQAIHLGGTTQVLFGIIGQRWLDNAGVAQLMNEHWVRPSDEETPSNPGRVEKSAYW